MTRSDGSHSAGPAGGAHVRAPFGLLMAASMAIGRGSAARLVADLAGVVPGDRVLDLGCGPGRAAREAARRGAVVTGVDPAQQMLRMARFMTRPRPQAAVTFVQGAAEAIPLPAAAVTAAWAVSSAHHWSDIRAGLSELRRVLAPGGRLVVMERQSLAGARGLAAHGFTPARAEEFAAAALAAGFADVRRETARAGRQRVTVIRARRA